MPCRPVVEGAGGVISDWTGLPLTLESRGRLLAAKDLPDMTLNVLRLSTDNLTARLMAEANNPQADIVLNLSVTNTLWLLSRRQKSGVFHDINFLNCRPDELAAPCAVAQGQWAHCIMSSGG